MEFLDFVAQLPQIEARPQICPSRDVRYVEQENPTFVGPSLEPVTPVVPGRTAVVLLSAPAAVGKSTVAAEIARLTGAPLWNLASFQVGHDTYLGTLAATFGPSALAETLHRLASGKFLVILDALDEAEIRAGAKNFEAFLGDLSAACRDPRERPAVLLLV